jgi:hypothetical protein
MISNWINLGRIGMALSLVPFASGALPTLKEGLNDPDVNVRNAFQTAIDWIENPKEEPPTPRQLKQQQALGEQIAKFCQQRANSP